MKIAILGAAANKDCVDLVEYSANMSLRIKFLGFSMCSVLCAKNVKFSLWLTRLLELTASVNF